jgi:hypothetical protein
VRGSNTHCALAHAAASMAAGRLHRIDPRERRLESAKCLRIRRIGPSTWIRFVFQTFRRFLNKRMKTGAQPSSQGRRFAVPNRLRIGIVGPIHNSATTGSGRSPKGMVAMRLFTRWKASGKSKTTASIPMWMLSWIRRNGGRDMMHSLTRLYRLSSKC